MPEDKILQFIRAIEPYKDLLDQLTVACAAVRVQDRWIALFSKIGLSNALDAGHIREEIIEPDPKFLALFARCEVEALEAMLYELNNLGVMSIGTADKRFEIYASRAHAGAVDSSPRLNFMGVIEPSRRNIVSDGFRPKRELHDIGSDHVYDLLSQEDVSRISTRLRLHRPPINGLGGMLKLLGSSINPEHSSQNAAIEVVAVLPFSFGASLNNVYVDCPNNIIGRLKVVCFFSPFGTRESYPDRTEPSGREGMARVHFKIGWLPETVATSVYLYYANEKVDELHLGRWSGSANWRFGVDSFFDPEQKLLRKSLQTGTDSGQFEHAIVRVLSLGGLPSVWYGKSRESARPDLAVTYESRCGKRIVLLGECTLDKPMAKLSPLKSRARELTVDLAGSAEIIPVIFTACQPAAADYKSAAAEGITLFGRDEVAELLDAVRGGSGAEAVFKLLSSRFAGTLGYY